MKKLKRVVSAIRRTIRILRLIDLIVELVNGLCG